MKDSCPENRSVDFNAIAIHLILFMALSFNTTKNKSLKKLAL